MKPLTQSELELLANNPIRGFNRIVDEIEANWNDQKVTLNSKSHPAVLMMDLILGTSHGFINQLLDLNSRKFLMHSRNLAELSMNMADDERFGIFANPAESTALLAIDVDTFNDISVERQITVGRNTVTYKELLVPKDTVLTLEGYDFWIANGIIIQQNESTGWKVVYDDTTNNPYIPIAGNLLERDYKVMNGRRYLLIYIPVKQIGCQATENITANEASGCRGEISYRDYLYGVRAFHQSAATGELTEIRVSYDQDVFDPLTVTLAISIDSTNKKFGYEIPDVYLAEGNGRGRGILRIYTYTTKGALSKDLTSVSPSKVVLNYQDYRYGAGTLNEFSAPLRNSGGIAWQLVAPVEGGENPVPFNEMKQRVIRGRQARTLPITENNLIGRVQQMDYNPVKTIDYMTKRSYALTKELPIQDNKGFFSPMACYIGSHLTSVNEMVLNGNVWDNGDRVTIPHNVLFNINNPTSVLVNSLTYNQYLAYTSEQLVDLMEKNTLVYTPFYYVMDMTNQQITLRTYHLDAPLVKYQTFLQENPALTLEVGVGALNIAHEDNGYRITLVTKSGQSYRQLTDATLGIQLSVDPVDSDSTANLAGTLVGVDSEGERIWEFFLETRWDIDVGDTLFLTNLNQFGQAQKSTGVPLDLAMHFIFTRTGDKEVTKSELDALIDDSIFRVEMVGIIETRYRVQLGKKLKNLYSRIRPLVGEAQYKLYEEDVPEVYLQTEYKRVDGRLVFDEKTGKPITLHKEGDVKYNSDGTPRLLYRRGIDYVVENGQYVVMAPRYLRYHWDFIAFDANYFFSRDDYDKQFAQETKDFFTVNVTGDMEKFSSEAIDITSLYFQPRSKLGFTNVVVNGNFETILKQDMRIVVTFYLTESGYRNPNLRSALERTTPRKLNEALFNKTTISVTELTNAVLKDVDPAVVTAKLSAMAGDVTVDVISNLDDLTGFCIAKMLELSSDGLVSVREAIDITFQPHDIRMKTAF